MRIALIIDAYLPSRKSVAKLAGDLVAEFIRLGHSVIVLTASDEAREPCEVEQDGARLTILRARTGHIKGASKLVRGINEWRLSGLFWRRMGGHLRAANADLIIYYSPSIFFGPLVKRLKALWGAKSYLVLRDIFPDWAVETGVLRKGLVYRYLKLWERRCYEAADRIGLESTGSLAYFSRLHDGRGHSTEVLYNWSAEDSGEPATPSYRKRLGLEDKVVFFFGGNIGVAQDMDNLLRLAKCLRGEKRAHFLLVGDGSEVPRIHESIASERLGNVTLLPGVLQAEYLSMLREFDVGIISLDRRLKGANVPGKMLGYMACGLPVLASVNPGSDLPVLIGEAKAGFCCLNGDDEALARQALSLLRDADLRHEMGRNSRRLLEDRFRVGAAARQILQLVAPAGHLGAS